MLKTLVDSGPFIALFNRDDRYHLPVKDFLKNFRGHMFTSWPVITEVSHLLDFNSRAQIDFLKWIVTGAVRLIDLDETDLRYLIQLMEKYSDRPMDLADGSLMAIAESRDIRNIVTLDSDYDIYRTVKKKALTNLMQDHL